MSIAVNFNLFSNISIKKTIPDHKSIHRGAKCGDVGDDSVFQLHVEVDAQLRIVAIDLKSTFKATI